MIVLCSLLPTFRILFLVHFRRFKSHFYSCPYPDYIYFCGENKKRDFQSSLLLLEVEFLERFIAKINIV